TVDYSTGWVEIVPDRVGRTVFRSKARSELMTALEEKLPIVELPVKMLKPSTTTDEFDQVLLVRIGENKLYLYEDGEIVESWPVATGLPEYATPTGIYEVTEKRYLPTWVNPAPDTWGADMPAEIPPGPGNPLGLRAINWSAPAIRFHGTSALYSLGYNASHGCVRMSNEDVIQLYDMIEVGTPIVSTVVAPLKPLYASAPDPTVVPEDEGDERPSTDPDEKRKNRERG
ncbi:MAG TPA: L,D-transpeptidase, partial [Actinomycetota bacterium]|nr:L,D-transpeptidase [Actinomycetota bacterium]